MWMTQLSQAAQFPAVSAKVVAQISFKTNRRYLKRQNTAIRISPGNPLFTTKKLFFAFKPLICANLC
jgi:hypothetical protein